MTDISRTILEWTYQPKNFFEERTKLHHVDGLIELGEGKARIDTDVLALLPLGFDASVLAKGRES